MARKRQKQRQPTAGAASPPAMASPPVSRSRLRAIQFFLVIALIVSAYLAFLSLSGGKAVGCGPESGCDKVISSRWASWFNIPVSVMALVVDSLFLAATLRLRSSPSTPDQPPSWAGAAISACTVLLAGAAVWFIGLQIVVMRSICPYCVVAHGAGLVAAVLSVRSFPVVPRFAAAGAGALALMIAGQVAYSPKSFVVQQIAAAPSNAPSSAPATPASPGARSGPPPAAASVTNRATASPAPPGATMPADSTGRLFPVYGGRFFVDVDNLPTIGSPTNAQVVVALHDFTCHHCREMHPELTAAQRAFSNQVVVVTLPMPFDPNCNPMMKQHNPKHTNACAYARLSLAVWRVDRSKHHDFDEYLFADPQTPPSVPDAVQTAERLVGARALSNALDDPWVMRQIQLGIGIYEAAYRAGQGQMPQVLIGQNTAVGTLSRKDLIDLMSRNFGLTPAPSTP